MAQIARPISDINVGSWSPYPADPTTLFDKIDEVIPNDDADYIVSSTDEDECEFGLTGVTAPSVKTGHKIRCYARSVAGAGAGEQMYIALVENGTVRGQSPATNTSRTSYALIEYTLSEAEATAIQNYANLRLRFHITKTDADEPIRITQAEFECPDAQQEVLLDGTSGAVSSLSGEVKRTRKIAGIINAVASVVGNLTVGGQILLNGISSAISSVAGEFKVTRKIDATASATSFVLADLILAYSLKGIASAQSALSGKLTIVGEAMASRQGMRGDGYFLNL